MATVPRTVDPARHAARRLGIIDAALTRFAADGYEATTTASICAEAGIGSGTFFHYFPTKADVLLGILSSAPPRPPPGSPSNPGARTRQSSCMTGSTRPSKTSPTGG